LATEQVAQLEENFLKILAEFTAGDPMREGVLWTNLSRCEISRRLKEMGTPASRHTVRKLLKKHGLWQRKVRKKKSLGAHPGWDTQFHNIAKLKAAYLAAGDPVISIDTKKKELIGTTQGKAILIHRSLWMCWTMISPLCVLVSAFLVIFQFYG